MALTVRRRGDNGLSAWPGYVDALSTLLMVIIFVLLVFVLAQAFLSVALSGRDKQLAQVNQQLADVSDMLSLERGRSANLQQSISQLDTELSATSAARDTLSQQLAALKSQAEHAVADRDALRADRDRLAQQLAAANQSTAAAKQETGTVAAQLGDTRRQLADSQARLAELQRQMAELSKTVRADKETIETKLSDLAKLAEQNRALLALRDDLEKQAQDAAARAMTDEQRRTAVETQLSGERRLGDSARAQVALLNRQVDELKAQLTSVAKALDLAKGEGAQKDTQIANLGQKLNVALASKVEELQRYRSEFFGKLRDVLANRPGIQIVGDRFVFQSEVLFPVGSADLTSAGQNEITALAVTIKDIAAEIPPDIHWILRVDGHTDRQPIKTGGQFASNWELSAARAITVVKLLIADGVPADHVAATGFADYQPLDPADTPEAYAKDRRIELRLTDR
ncbi:MAG TPA: peptidoglycan -binding protein [Acetobacteraceae bacterium]|nr:peptidoglycan -binding protein [Acetobacteraceae bacterium]